MTQIHLDILLSVAHGMSPLLIVVSLEVGGPLAESTKDKWVTWRKILVFSSDGGGLTGGFCQGL